MLRKSGLRKLSWLRRERSGQGESGALECEPGLFEGRLCDLPRANAWTEAALLRRLQPRGRKPCLNVGGDFRLSGSANKLIALDPRRGALGFLAQAFGPSFEAVI
jgi:hypothetical protein